MTQLIIKVSLCKHKDPSLDPWHPMKAKQDCVCMSVSLVLGAQRMADPGAC